jgi:Flp pilus assembly pilin Flp
VPPSLRRGPKKDNNQEVNVMDLLQDTPSDPIERDVEVGTEEPTSTSPVKWSDESGQSTAEYALVMLGAAAVATLLITWATGSGAIGRLFDAVVNDIITTVTG